MTHHQNIGAHGIESRRRVQERLALLNRTGGHRHVNDIRTQMLPRQLKGCARARRILKK